MLTGGGDARNGGILVAAHRVAVLVTEADVVETGVVERGDGGGDALAVQVARDAGLAGLLGDDDGDRGTGLLLAAGVPANYGTLGNRVVFLVAHVDAKASHVESVACLGLGHVGQIGHRGGVRAAGDLVRDGRALLNLLAGSSALFKDLALFGLVGFFRSAALQAHACQCGLGLVLGQADELRNLNLLGGLRALGDYQVHPRALGLLGVAVGGLLGDLSLIDIVVVALVDGANLKAGFLDQLNSGFLVLAQHIGHRDLFATEHARGKGHYDANHGDGGNHGGDDLVLVGLRLLSLVGARGARDSAAGGILTAHARDGTNHSAR